jgi:hypothetical protein
MSWSDETYIIGEKVKVLDEPELGVVTRIDFESGLFYVLFPRGREIAFAYPEDYKTKVELVNKNVEKKYLSLVKDAKE